MMTDKMDAVGMTIMLLGWMFLVWRLRIYFPRLWVICAIAGLLIIYTLCLLCLRRHHEHI